MNTIERNGVKYRWSIEGGGKGLLVENKYIKKPYCRVTLESDKMIEEPEKLVERILGVLFPDKKAELPFDEEIAMHPAHWCAICGKVCKSAAGLHAHTRSHNKKENKHGKKR